MNLMGGVLGIIAAGVKKEADVVSGKHLEETVHIPGGFFGVLFEIDFVTACPQRRRGRGLEAVYAPGFLLININDFLIEDAEDAVKPAVNLFDALVAAGLLQHTGHARVDDGGGAA